MNLKEELNKAEYDLTSEQVDMFLELFEKWVLDMVGEDGLPHEISGEVNRRNELRQEIRQRIEEATK